MDGTNGTAGQARPDATQDVDAHGQEEEDGGDGQGNVVRTGQLDTHTS